jgi:hypothetical protein
MLSRGSGPEGDCSGTCIELSLSRQLLSAHIRPFDYPLSSTVRAWRCLDGYDALLWFGETTPVQQLRDEPRDDPEPQTALTGE